MGTWLRLMEDPKVISREIVTRSGRSSALLPGGPPPRRAARMDRSNLGPPPPHGWIANRSLLQGFRVAAAGDVLSAS